MNTIVIGLGSMGKRRVRLLQKNHPNISIYGVDARPDRRKECSTLFGISVYENIDHAVRENDIQLAFVCTSPLSHGKIILECLEREFHVFSEINLVSEYHKEISILAKEKRRIVFLSSTPLYRKETKFIADVSANYSKQVQYRYHVGQYLPDWHPWEKIEDFFVSDRRTNGCREIFTIELPWLIRAFGNISKITSQSYSVSGLQLCYPDSYHVIIEHKSGATGSLSVDVISYNAVRSFEMYSENLYLTWDGTPEGLFYSERRSEKSEQARLYALDEVEKNQNYAENIIENAYEDEIAEFILGVQTGDQSLNDRFKFDEELLNIVDTIEDTSKC